MTTIQASFRVTLFGVTRWTLCESWDEGARFHSVEYVAIARVGRGAKFWPAKVWFFRKQDGTYTQSASSVHLNRTSILVAFANDVRVASLSRHNSAVEVRR